MKMKRPLLEDCRFGPDEIFGRFEPDASGSKALRGGLHVRDEGRPGSGGATSVNVLDEFADVTPASIPS